MLLFSDVVTGDEMFSDAFPVSVGFQMTVSNPSNPRVTLHSKLVDDIVYEVDCQLITVKDGDVDIGILLNLPQPLLHAYILQVPIRRAKRRKRHSKMERNKSTTLSIHSDFKGPRLTRSHSSRISKFGLRFRFS
jgi:hypothetical protein